MLGVLGQQILERTSEIFFIQTLRNLLYTMSMYELFCLNYFLQMLFYTESHI
jgi:hypothetical protein